MCQQIIQKGRSRTFPIRIKKLPILVFLQACGRKGVQICHNNFRCLLPFACTGKRDNIILYKPGIAFALPVSRLQTAHSSSFHGFPCLSQQIPGILDRTNPVQFFPLAIQKQQYILLRYPANIDKMPRKIIRHLRVCKHMLCQLLVYPVIGMIIHK